MTTNQEIDFLRIDLPALFRELVGTGALGYRRHPDGSLTLIDSQGRKHTFTAEEVRRALQRVEAPRKPQEGRR
jgi:hypothetical protein